jgi:hypothetical protein
LPAVGYAGDHDLEAEGSTWQEEQVKDAQANVIGRAIATAAGLAAAIGGIVAWALGIASLFGADVYAPEIAILWLVAIVVPFVLAATLLMKEKAEKRPGMEGDLTLVSGDAKVSLPLDEQTGTDSRPPASAKFQASRAANRFGPPFDIERKMNDVPRVVRVSPALLRQFDLACRVVRRSRSSGIRDAMAAYVRGVAESCAINENDASGIKLLRRSERGMDNARTSITYLSFERPVEVGANPGTNLSASERNSEQEDLPEDA